ncbi:hypothetical protein [Shewanella woodyi]|uniref:Lipoprotein n=1 Tax=Shewanella woodyi (strain ATCC 51908 / MS32) TaxID=392500 RepID=B1KFK4_SHEWM|nr:hypothetical protein [Shewanella woodyi]ACA88179.1 hypothetical protein Swoo_3921 [Shewanella woodyi ATCC 51908]
MHVTDYKHWLAHLILTGFMLLVSGCSFNNFGIASESHIALYQHAKIVTNQASGLHIYTEPMLGIQLGHIEQRLVYPLLSTEHSVCIDQILDNTSKIDEPEKVQKYANTPVIVSSQKAGLGFSASPYHIRVDLGSSSRKTLRVDQKDSISIYYLNAAQKRDEDICAVLKIKPTDRDINDE